jgi:hypothetical protein
VCADALRRLTKLAASSAKGRATYSTPAQMASMSRLTDRCWRPFPRRPPSRYLQYGRRMPLQKPLRTQMARSIPTYFWMRTGMRVGKLDSAGPPQECRPLCEPSYADGQAML